MNWYIYLFVITWAFLGLFTAWAVAHYWKTVWNRGVDVFCKPVYAFYLICTLGGVVSVVTMAPLLWRFRPYYAEARRRRSPLL